MKNNFYLKKLLTTKAVNLPKAYGYLVDEIYSNSDKICLYDLIEQSQAKLGEGKVFFSKLDDKIVGWAGYATDPLQKEVVEIKMFSFYLESNQSLVLLSDLTKFLIQLKNKYEKVSWAALTKNPANKLYLRAIEKFHGTREVSKDGKIAVYSIPGTKQK